MKQPGAHRSTLTYLLSLSQFSLLSSVFPLLSLSHSSENSNMCVCVCSMENHESSGFSRPHSVYVVRGPAFLYSFRQGELRSIVGGVCVVKGKGKRKKSPTPSVSYETYPETEKLLTEQEFKESKKKWEKIEKGE